MSRPFVYYGRVSPQECAWFLLHRRCYRSAYLFDPTPVWMTTYHGPYGTASEANDAALRHLEMEHPDD